MSDFQIINPINHKDWDTLLLTNPQSSIFHTAAWARVLNQSYGFKPYYFTVIENSKLKSLIAVMEVNTLFSGKKGVSLPFADFCSPIAENKPGFETLFGEVVAFGKKKAWKTIELRGGQEFLTDNNPETSINNQQSKYLPREIHERDSETDFTGVKINSKIVPSESFLTHTLDLAKPEKEIQASFWDSTRRNIKKSEKQGVAVKAFNTIEAVKTFYELHCRTRRYHGMPPQPFYFFGHLHAQIISKHRGRVVLASVNGNDVAGAIFLEMNGNVIFKYGASDKKYHKFRPNNLIMWSAIDSFREENNNFFDLGRTELKNNGLRQYKKGWGTNEGILNYYIYDLGKNIFITNRYNLNSLNLILKKMPLALLRLTGHFFYRYMG